MNNFDTKIVQDPVKYVLLGNKWYKEDFIFRLIYEIEDDYNFVYNSECVNSIISGEKDLQEFLISNNYLKLHNHGYLYKGEKFEEFVDKIYSLED